jgi:hypothetical protein
LIAIADEVYVVHLRRGGNIEHLVRARLKAGVCDPPGIFIPLDSQLVEDQLARDLMDSGATPWPAENASQEICAASTGPSRSASVRSAKAKVLNSLPHDCRTWLSHTTRAIRGAWPDQSQDEYIAELLDSRGGVPHTACESLLRIASQQRLIATGQGIRGGTRVVCFTEVPLDDLPRMRVYRPHRGRWDFEPFGIAILREWLAQRGARPVIYGDEDTWQSLRASERPFFQRRTSVGRSGRAYDWSVEKEWRYMGDLDLAALPDDAGLLFVGEEDAARTLAPVSRWPVVVLAGSVGEGT